MKAIRVASFGDPGVLHLCEAPDPVAGPGQVVVRVRAVGVNPVETYVRSGAYARLPELPYTPGVDGAGEIESAGEGVDLPPGLRVAFGGTLSGAYAEKALCLVEQVHHLPDTVDFAQGAALGIPYVTAWCALFAHGRLQPGERVLVHGASGGVGIAAMQLARAAGGRVVGSAGSIGGMNLLLTHGMFSVVDHEDDAHLDDARELAGGDFDVIVENLANRNLGRDLDVLAHGGRVVVVGTRGTMEINPRALMQRCASIHGLILWNTPADVQSRAWAAIHAGLENGSLDPIVGPRFALADAAQAHRAILGSRAAGKIVLVP